MFSDFPSLHPLIVHFPIVLILIAVPFQAVLVWRQWEQIRWVTLLIMVFAFLSALAASTIFHAEPSEDAPRAALEIFSQHEIYAQYTMWMSGFTLVLKTIGDAYKINRRSYQIVILIAAAVSALFLSIAGHHGARLTHVAGIGPMGRYLMKEHGGEDSGMDMKKMTHPMEMDSTIKKNDEMPAMKNMSGKDTSADMKNMQSMNTMNHINQNKTNDMKNMEGMDHVNNMNGKEMKNMDNSKTMKGMNNMDNMHNMKSMNDEDMMSVDTTKKMQGMDNMNGMNNNKSMNMPEMNMSNPLDTFKFEDNNPAFQQKKN